MASEELSVLTSEAKEEINALIGNGLQVLNVPEDCLCSNCGMLAIFHFTNGCSHLYCRSCYFAFKLENRNCRKCKTTVGTKRIKNDSIDLAIANLKTECANKNLGCNEVVALRDLLEHAENCEFSTMKAVTVETFKRTISNLENMFEAKFQQSAKEFSAKLEETANASKEHIETTTNMISEKLSAVMELCKTNSMNAEQKLESVEANLLNLQKDISGNNQRTEQLEKFVVDHKKNLETRDKVDITLSDINTEDVAWQHRTDFFSNELNKFRETIDQLRISLEETKSLVAQLTHEKSVMTENLTDVEKTIATAQGKIDSTVDFVSKKDFTQFQGLQAQNMNCTIERLRGPYNGTFIWKIHEFSKKKKLKSTLYSEYFYSNTYGYRMRVLLQFNKSDIGVLLCFEPSEQENHLPSIFHHKWTHFILDQSDRQEKIHISKTYEPNFRDVSCHKYMIGGWGTDLCSYEHLERLQSVYLKNDQLFVKTVVDPALDCTVDILSCQGVLIWKVSKYRKIKQESLHTICDEVWSDSFYSSEFGYRMRISLEFAGGHLFVSLKFIVGQFDDDLPDIFAHKVTFSILDQVDQNGKNSLLREKILDPKKIGDKRAKEKMSSNDSCHSVAFLTCDFEKMPFLVDDSILIEVVVEPI